MPHFGEKCLADSELFFQGVSKPGPRILPVPVSDGAGDPQHLARLLDGEAAEQVEMSDPRCRSVFLPESGEQFVKRQDEGGVFGEAADLIEQFES